MSTEMPPTQASPTSLIGQVVAGNFRVLEKIGEGGMGVVYLAEQLSLGRKVALKVLHQRYTRDEEFSKRFRREARLAASLNHINIVTMYDFGQEGDERLFIAMEYVEGENLKVLLQKHALVCS